MAGPPFYCTQVSPKGDQTASWETVLKLLCIFCHSSGVPRGWGQGLRMPQRLSPGPEGPQDTVTSLPGSEITENADVCKVSPVAVGVEAEQEGPLEGNEAPDTGEVVAGGVCEALVPGDGQREEGAEGSNGDG